MPKNPSNDYIMLDEILKKEKQQIDQGMSDSDFFELFCFSQMFKDAQLDYSQYEKGWVDNGNDGGIDGWFTFINEELVQSEDEITHNQKKTNIEVFITQQKRTNSFSDNSIKLAKDTLDKLLDLNISVDDFPTQYNLELRENACITRIAIFKNITNDLTVNIHFFYFSMGTHVHENVQIASEELVALVSEKFSYAEVDFKFVGADMILEWFRTSPSETSVLNFDSDPIYQEATESSGNGKISAIIGLVTLKNYLNFIAPKKTLSLDIFDTNIRDFQPNTEVNKEIYSTLGSPDTGVDFWWVNNGISIIADNIKFTGKTVTLENPKIVNGLQTSHSIFNFSKEHCVDEKRSILVRIIDPGDDVKRNLIIKGTNSQTSIQKGMLRALDIFQINLENFLLTKEIFYERRKSFYKNLKKPRKQIISMNELAQIASSILLMSPHDAKARPGDLLRRDDIYESIFNNNIKIEFYVKGIRLYQTIKQFITHNNLPETIAINVNDLKFHLMTLISLFGTRNLHPSAQEVISSNIDVIEDYNLENTFTHLWQLYEDYSSIAQIPQSRISRSSEFTEYILENSKNPNKESD